VTVAEKAVTANVLEAFGAWQGLVVPTGTPKEINAKLNAEYAKAVADPTVKQRLFEAGIEPITSTPEEFVHLHKK